MPSVLAQIEHMSTADKMQIMKYIMNSIEQTIVDMVPATLPKRTLVPDPQLHCEIKCDLFEDDSAQWENA